MTGFHTSGASSVYKFVRILLNIIVDSVSTSDASAVCRILSFGCQLYMKKMKEVCMIR